MSTENNNIDVIDESVENLIPSEDDSAEEKVYELPLGEELSLGEIYKISSSEVSKLIMFAGSVGCGKTTLLTSIYHQFLSSAENRYYFMGSKTLLAFEQRAHFTRIQSNQSSPVMQRTNNGVLDSYLHLKLYDTQTKYAKNIFISDFSGEDFDKIKGSVDTAKEELAMVKQMKLLCIILDGKKITSSQFRYREINNAKMLLKTLNDAELLHNSAKVIAIVSKYDLIKNKYGDNVDEIHKILNEIKQNIVSEIPKREDEMVVYTVAALPELKNNVVPIGYGLENIIDLLFEDYTQQPKILAPSKISTTSQFNLFGRRNVYG